MQGAGYSMFCPLVRLHSKIRHADMLNDPLVDHVWMNDVKICQVQQDEQDEQDDVDHAWSWSIYVNVFILFLFNVTRPPILPLSHSSTKPRSLRPSLMLDHLQCRFWDSSWQKGHNMSYNSSKNHQHKIQYTKSIKTWPEFHVEAFMACGHISLNSSH